MTNDSLLHEVKEAIRSEMGVHVSYIREDIGRIRDEIGEMKKHGCAVGVQNRQRLDELDKRASIAGGLTGAIVAAMAWLGNYFAGRGAQ